MSDVQDAEFEMVTPEEVKAPEVVWTNANESLPPPNVCLEVITQSKMPGYIFADEEGKQFWRVNKDFREEIIVQWRVL